MAVARSAFLCQSALVHDGGLISCFGMGITTIRVQSLAAIVSFTVVADIGWSEGEADETHLAIVKVGLGDELVSRAELPAQAPRWNAQVPGGTFLIQGISFDARGITRLDKRRVVAGGTPGCSSAGLGRGRS